MADMFIPLDEDAIKVHTFGLKLACTLKTGFPTWRSGSGLNCQKLHRLT